MGHLGNIREKIQERSQAGGRYVRRVSTSVYAVIALYLLFGLSAISKAAQRVKRVIQSRKIFLRSSQSSHLMTSPWGYFHASWDESELPRSAAEDYDVLRDPNRRVESDFRVPSELKARVRFWAEIYSRYSSHYRVVHDRDNPEIVYGVIDLTPIYQNFSARAAASKAWQLDKKIQKELKERISEAMDITRPRKPKLSAEEREEIRDWLAGFDVKDAVSAQRLLKRMRSQSGQRDKFEKAVQRSEKYLPQIEELFRQRGLPVALARLPFVESSFNPHAVSRSGAIGMWQFMPETARRFHPTGGPKEWTDPVSQSRSAARMLTILRERLGDWGIAVTAYNSGAVRLARLVKEHKAESIADLIDLEPRRGRLGFAGKNFYCELLAAIHVEAYKDKIFPQQTLLTPTSGIAVKE